MKHVESQQIPIRFEKEMFDLINSKATLHDISFVMEVRRLVALGIWTDRKLELKE